MSEPMTMKFQKQLDRLETSHTRMLSKIFRKYQDIRAVYMFGSVASGDTHPESDLDLAIIPYDGSIRGKKVSILSDLASSGFCDVDLIFLDTDDIVLKFEAIRQNKLIYCTPGFDRGGLYSKIVRQYLDFVPYLKVQREAYKRRLQNG